MAPFRDYYDVLGVPRTATDEQIQDAYRKRARENHPDLHPAKNKDEQHRRMQEINEAYAVLKSKEDRAKYDRFGEHWKDGPPPPPEGPSPGFRSSRPSQADAEAFSEFFRQTFGGGVRMEEAEELSASELDIEANLELSLAEAAHGVEKSFSLTVSGLCHACRGTGHKNGAFCRVCGGVGEIRRAREVKTKIPLGLMEGSRIRLRGQGNEGPKGNGDLFLQIHLAPDPRFSVDGANLETKVAVMPWTAALGGEISVPTLEGAVRVRVPKASRSGSRLRLAGKGLGKPAQRGDLFARLEIDNPASLTPEMESLFRQMEEKSNARVP